MAQQRDPKERLITFAMMMALWLGMYFLLQQFVFPKPPPPPAQAQAIHQQAVDLETAGRKDDPNVSRADRVKKLEQAVGKYEEFYRASKAAQPVEAAKARFQAVNVLDYLAQYERGDRNKQGNTHWYDQAEQKLKEMENDFRKLEGSVTLEVNGQKIEKSGNLGQIATERLDSIRAARDEVNRTKITYQVLDWLVHLTGAQPAFSYAFALALIVVVLKLATWPFQKKQYQYQKDMMRIQPLIKEAQEKLKGRPPEEVNRRMFQIYKENNVNLAGGCLPMLVMMVVLFPVFWMVRDYEYQFTHATFLWIGSQWAQHFSWIASNLAQFDVPLFAIYLISTVFYSLLQPKPADPQQAQQQKIMLFMMPLMFGWFMWIGKWSSAFMLYWLILNIVSMIQSWMLMKQFGLVTGHAGTPGGTPEAAPASPPLQPMKGVEGKGSNGSNGRNGKGGHPAHAGRVRPRSGRRK